jgi:nucleotide-binding universal stress UspA family protein
MPGTIVVGYDGSEGARAALDEALALAGELGSQVHLVFAFEAPRLGGELRDLDEAIAERALVVLERGVHQAAGKGVEVTTEHLKTDPAEGLIAVAAEKQARYIVVGSNGERPLKSALVGSTPTRLLHLSDRPVLVVRGPE